MKQCSHKLALAGGLTSVGEASAWVRTLAAQHGVAKELAENLDLCLNEVLANIVDYAYAGAPGEIDLELCLDASSVALVIEDAGPAFNPLEFAEPTIPASLETATIGGFGIYLVRQFADACHYERHNNHNRLTLCFGECPQP